MSARLADLPAGCSLIRASEFRDNRGSLLKVEICDAKQIITVCNEPDTLRGVHAAPSKKTVFIVLGSVFDVLVDLRESSSTYGRWWGGELRTGWGLDIAAGVGHAYYSERASAMTYAIEKAYDPHTEIRIQFNDPTLHIDWPLGLQPLSTRVSRADWNNHRFAKILIYGSSGFLGSLISAQLQQDRYRVTHSQVRLPDWQAAEEEVRQVKPDCVIFCVGKSGVPSSTWHDLHPEESLAANVEWPVTLAKLCRRVAEETGRPIYSVFLGSGVVFSASDRPHDENEPFHPVPSGYGEIRRRFEQALAEIPGFFQNGCILRIMYPVVPGDPRCLLTKLKAAKSLHNVPSSLSVMPDLLPLLTKIIQQRVCGAINFVNPGPLSPLDLVRRLHSRGDAPSTPLPPVVSKENNVAAVWLAHTKLEEIAGHALCTAAAAIEKWSTSPSLLTSGPRLTPPCCAFRLTTNTFVS